MLISFTFSLNPHINPMSVFILEIEKLRNLQELTGFHSVLSTWQNTKVQNTCHHTHHYRNELYSMRKQIFKKLSTMRW